MIQNRTPKEVPSRATIVMICINLDILSPEGLWLLHRPYQQSPLRSRRTQHHLRYHPCHHRNSLHHPLYRSLHHLCRIHPQRKSQKRIKKGTKRSANTRRKIALIESGQSQGHHQERIKGQGQDPSLQLGLSHPQHLHQGKSLVQFLVYHLIHIGQIVVGLYLRLVVTLKDPTQDHTQGQDHVHAQGHIVGQGQELIPGQGLVHYQGQDLGQHLQRDHLFQICLI